MKTRLFCAGSGGQGALAIGLMVAKAGMEEGREVTWMPSYGPEMRGGTANCTVIVSDRPISSPVISKTDILVAMNLPSLTKFEGMVVPGGYIFVNSSLVSVKSSREDVKAVYVPANDIAIEIGNDRAANIVMLGAILKETGICAKDTIIHQMEKTFSGKKARFLPANIAALEHFCA